MNVAISAVALREAECGCGKGVSSGSSGGRVGMAEGTAKSSLWGASKSGGREKNGWSVVDEGESSG